MQQAAAYIGRGFSTKKASSVEFRCALRPTSDKGVVRCGGAAVRGGRGGGGEGGYVSWLGSAVEQRVQILSLHRDWRARRPTASVNLFFSVRRPHVANGYISYARFRVLSASGECAFMSLHLDTWEAHLGSTTSDSCMSARSRVDRHLRNICFPEKWRCGDLCLWVQVSQLFQIFI